MSKSSRQRKSRRRMAEKCTINKELYQPGTKVNRKSMGQVQSELQMTAGGGNNYH